MVTSYMYHHYVQVLISRRKEEIAQQVIKVSWEGMIREGIGYILGNIQP